MTSEPWRNRRGGAEIERKMLGEREEVARIERGRGAEREREEEARREREEEARRERGRGVEIERKRRGERGRKRRGERERGRGAEREREEESRRERERKRCGERERKRCINEGKGDIPVETLARFEKDVKPTDIGFLAIATEVENDGENTLEPPGKTKELLKEFQDILHDDLPNELPPYRTHQHEIVEEPGSKPTFRAPYRLSPTELIDMKNRSSISLPKDSSDHRLRHTVPQCSSHRNRTEACACASITGLLTSRPSRINIRYHESMTCLTIFEELRYFPNWICGPDTGRYEWRTTLSTKLPSELGMDRTTKMNHILRPLLDECMVVYLDDILIYSRNMKQHVEHLRRVFEILRRERLYVKLSKSEFALKKVQFLGHMVSAQEVHVDPKKIEAVRMWKTPENVKDLQQFLGFANYYNRFVPQYAKLAAPLTNC
ncbi:hypothetical protein CLOP_g11458 [Closterium sp. NIES-67]|nr:hypothetical protein CLOP_g11458 [Closterium sp. NIES-67]